MNGEKSIKDLVETVKIFTCASSELVEVTFLPIAEAHQKVYERRD